MPKNNLKMSVTLLSQFDPNLQRIYHTCFEDTYYFNSNLLLNAKNCHTWSRSLSCRIVLKLHFQLFNSVDIFSQWMAISQVMSKRKRFNGWHAKSWLLNCCFLSAKQRVSLIKFAKLKWATEEIIMTLWYGPWGIILTHNPIENHNKTDMCWAG